MDAKKPSEPAARLNTVELELMCHGVHPPHLFRRAWTPPVDWAEVTMWLKSDDPRCEEHPQWSNCYYDD